MTFLSHEHSYYYGTNTKTEYRSSASPSCTARSDPMKPVKEKKGNMEVKIHQTEAILFTLDITHTCLRGGIVKIVDL